MERDIIDLQSEFEYDRVDYLDTIRKQDQQIQWLEAVLEKIHPCLRRDCNYANLDRIKSASEWLEDENDWSIPSMRLERGNLPDSECTQLYLPGLNVTKIANAVIS